VEAARVFSERGIPTKVILDAAVGANMEGVDMCLVGAEGVMENGGIVNKVSGAASVIVSVLRICVSSVVYASCMVIPC
jgi:translation initiation factor eIF-2B subunit alpha